MAAPQGDSLTAQLAGTLSEEQRLFCVQVASGMSYREAAVTAGFHEEYGKQLSCVPKIRDQISRILEGFKGEDLSSIASKAWIETQLVVIAKAALYGSPAQLLPDGRTLPEIPRNHVHAAKVLMDIAKLKGLIVERKLALNTNVGLGQMQRTDVMAGVGKLLDALEPGQRAKIKALLAAPVDGELADVEDAYDIELAGDTTTGSGRAKKR